MPNINDYGLPFTSQDGDRKYSALEWREYFSRLIHNGLIQNAANECQVKPQAAPNKTVYVDTGVVFINGAMRILEEPITLDVAENTSGNPRIDRVVARLNEASRTIEFAVLEGTPAGSPVAPALTRTAGVYELGLADITLANGYSTITAAEITDQRWDVSLCGASSMTIGVIPPSGLEAQTVTLSPEIAVLYYGDNVEQALKNNHSAFRIINNYSSVDGSRLLDDAFRNIFVGENTHADLLYSTDQALPSKFIVVDNMTIDSGVTVTTADKLQIVVVKDTLTLNGTLSAKGKGGAGQLQAGLVGSGAGGGSVILLANNVVGNGKIDASGVDGAYNTSSPYLFTGLSGGAGSFYGYTVGGGGGGARFAGAITNAIGGISTVADVLLKTFRYAFEGLSTPPCGAGGGSGAVGVTTSNYQVGGGAGGAGVIGAGANGGNAVNYNANSTTGNGGGGGGMIMMFCVGDIPSITLLAKGGKGSSATVSQSGVGGGGGGGYVLSVGRSHAENFDVSGGSNGTVGNTVGTTVAGAGLAVSLSL